ncbi:glutathione S-transferase family protein [Candidatus Comchoanobacter bicostacola]|uniref:Glutathione S-transferase family protein n=1 Tax=Candidatus Comchoanobacter bicostacola TaxID=2919598 RepID=A0ABY5DLR9_9GAMM|nr:glutathione S-transferase family protein [Candidatus Comchoanobacter bicostacola]UTC24716.1 glutathione S-transferase family protein [Candidatus Comchoanobacter bicostacola]
MNNINNVNTNPEITLWGLNISPYVRKIIAALEEKSLDYSLAETLPKSLLIVTNQEVANDFDQASPLGKIPALQVGDYSVADSAVIAAFLDGEYKSGNSLYPTQAKEKAKAMWFEKYADTVLSEVAYSKIFVERVVKPAMLNMEADEAMISKAIKDELPAHLDYLNLAASKNEWLAGNAFSMADIAVTTQLLALQMAGFDLEKANQWDALTKLMKTVMKRESFTKIIA